MSTDLADFVDGVPGRFVPDAMRGQLVEAEHLTRYWWACAFASGRRVLDAGSGTGYGSVLLSKAGATGVVGIDLADDVVAAAAAAAPEGVRFEVGDVGKLPYEDASFDLVTCFEVIEHIQDQERALREIARVLAPGGIVLVSSPNRDVYVPGNPHHVHELTPDELKRMLAVHWPHTRLVVQHNFLAATILHDVERPAGTTVEPVAVRALADKRAGEEVYTIGLASSDALPESEQLITLASPVEVREWLERFQEQQTVLHDLSTRLDESRRADGDRTAALARLAEAEQLAAELPALHTQLETATAGAVELYEQLRQARIERDRLAQRLERSERMLGDLTGSLSWRLTAPLRALKRLATRR